jgi:hypothetical protein
MGMFSKYFNKTVKTPVLIKKNWKAGMWVMTQDCTVGILTKLGNPCLVHIVNQASGETIKELSVDLNSLRQAKWHEIPECRRGITQAEGEALGYGT